MTDNFLECWAGSVCVVEMQQSAPVMESHFWTARKDELVQQTFRNIWLANHWGNLINLSCCRGENKSRTSDFSSKLPELSFTHDVIDFLIASVTFSYIWLQISKPCSNLMADQNSLRSLIKENWGLFFVLSSVSSWSDTAAQTVAVWCCVLETW